MRININEEEGEKGVNSLLSMTRDKKEIIKKMYSEGRIIKINESCFSVPSECFVLGITSKLIREVLK